MPRRASSRCTRRDSAPELVRKWAEAVQDCNRSLARLAEALDELYGLSSGR